MEKLLEYPQYAIAVVAADLAFTAVVALLDCVPALRRRERCGQCEHWRGMELDTGTCRLTGKPRRAERKCNLPERMRREAAAQGQRTWREYQTDNDRELYRICDWLDGTMIGYTVTRHPYGKYCVVHYLANEQEAQETDAHMLAAAGFKQV